MLKVLLIDDEPLIIETLLRVIPWHAYGMQVAGCASDGLAGLEYLQAHHVDIVFTDIRMPRLGGLELLKRVHVICPRITFVMISSWSDFVLVKESFQFGATDYLLKIDIDDHNILDGLMNRVKAAREQAVLEERGFHNALRRGLSLDAPPGARCKAIAIGAARERQLLRAVEAVRRLDERLIVKYAGGYAVCAHCEREDDNMDIVQFLSRLPADCLGDVCVGTCNGFETPDESLRRAMIAAFYADAGEVVEYRAAAEEYREAADGVIALANSDGASPSVCFDRLLISAKRGCALPETACEDVYRLFKACSARDESAGNFTNFLSGISHISALRDAAARMCQALDAQPSESSVSRLTQAYVMAHFDQPGLTLNTTAKALGISGRYISSELYASTNMHFKHYVNMLRIQKAISLMENTELRVNEICDMCGYVNAEHFSRVFSRHTGVSPIEYMRKARAVN